MNVRIIIFKSIIYICINIYFFFKQKTAYGMCISDWSSDVCSSDILADRTNHGRRNGFLWLFAAPDDELERRVEPLAFAERDVHHILDLFGRRTLGTPQQHGMTEDRQAVFRPEVEVAEPHLLVDHGQQGDRKSVV